MSLALHRGAATGTSLIHAPSLAKRISHRGARPSTSQIPYIRKSVRAAAIDAVSATADLPSVTPAGDASPTTFPPPLAPLDASYEDACAFTPFANWIIPGRVMLGRYPYVEPNRTISRDAGDSQLVAIIDSGVTTFVCLQAELPPQEQMRLAGVEGFLPYRAAVQMIASSRSDPPSLEEVGALRTPELDRYLPPRRRPANYPPRRRVAVDFVHSGITDLSIPAQQKAEELVEELVARLERGESMYIHCWGGRGRAGTVGSLLLGRMYGMSAEEALERVQRGFDTRRDDNRRSPETPEQIAFVKDYINKKLMNN